MHRLLFHVFRSSRRDSSLFSSAPRCLCSTGSANEQSTNNNNNKPTTKKLPILAALTTGVALGYSATKSSILVVLSKLGLHHDKVENYITSPEVGRSSDSDVDRYLKLCEAVMKIADKAVLTTTTPPPTTTASTTTEDRNNVDQENLNTQEANKDDARVVHHSSMMKSRPVAPFPVSPGIPHVHMMTNKLSRKVQHIQSNPDVVLTYLDGDGLGYVAIEGAVEILSDAESTSLWKPTFKLHYPEGPVSADVPHSRFVMLKLTPVRVEFSSVRFGTETAHDSWLPPALVRGGEGEWCVDPSLRVL